MTVLTIDFDNSRLQFKLVPGSDISDADWNRLVAKWFDRTTANFPERTGLFVDENTLKQDYSWFQQTWNSLNNSLEITTEARNRVAYTNLVREQFSNLIAGEYTQTDHIEVYSPSERPLTSHQFSCVEKLLTMPNGANFSVPGAGKTATTLALWKSLVIADKIDRLLVVSPKSAFESWESEIQFFGISSHEFSVFNGHPISQQVKLLVINYEQLQSPSNLELIKLWMVNSQVQLVLDEAHRIKAGNNSVRWRACKELSKHVARIDLLTGTPMPQGPEDIRSLFLLSWPGLNETDLSDEVIGSMRRGNTFVRTTKGELGLPPVEYHLIEKPMSDLQKQIYDALVKKYSGLLRLNARDARTLQLKGRAVMSLIAAATNPGLLSTRGNSRNLLNFTWPLQGYGLDSDLMDLIEKYSEVELNWKFVWLTSYLNTMAKQGKKVLLWTTFVGNILALKEILSPFNPAIVYGAITQEERAIELKRFRTDDQCSVLITNPQTLGEGISLHQVCHDSVYLDRSFNAGLYLQSLDRIHRLGLDTDEITNVTILSSVNSVDEKIENRLSAKIKKLGKLMEDEGLVESSSAIPYDPVEDKIGIAELLDLDAAEFESLFAHLAK